MTNEEIANELETTRWSNVPIGVKCLIVAAIEALRKTDKIEQIPATEVQADEVARQAGINPALAEAYMQGYQDSESRRQQTVQVPLAVKQAQTTATPESAFKAAFEVWQDKTEWVQKDRRFDVLLPWGKHRADVLREYIERLESIAAAPQVAQPVQVPDKWPEKLTWSHHDDMTQAEVLAWNNAIDACRAAMVNTNEPI